MQHTSQRHQPATSQPASQREAQPRSGSLSAQLAQSPRQAAQRRQLQDLRAGPVQRAEGLEEEDEAGAAQLRADPAQRQDNRTGMPDGLKAGIESLSGMDMSDLRVHRNSSQPAQLNALAYAQGNDIHLGPGQAQHLPHEAWHVVQQRQGRVQATMQMAGVGVNDDVGLEREADVMGGRAVQFRGDKRQDLTPKPGSPSIGAVIPAERHRRRAVPAAAPARAAGGGLQSARLAASPRQAAQCAAIGPLGVVQREARFAADTTYGMELEFTNRWLSLSDAGKDMPAEHWDAGALYQEPVPSPEMTVGGDDGRVGTVMEIETRVYGAEDWAQDRVHDEVAALLGRADAIVAGYRARQPAFPKQEWESLAAPRFGLEPQPVRDLLAPGVLDQLLPKAPLSKDDNGVASHADLLKVQTGLRSVPQATLQVTTLARRGPDHDRALDETMREVRGHNEKFDGLKVPSEAHAKALERADQILEDLGPLPESVNVVLDNLRVTVQTATARVAFNEIGGYGTVKNLPLVMPRRVVAPPTEGFAAAIRVPLQTYRKALGTLPEDLMKLQDDDLAPHIAAMLLNGLDNPHDELLKAWEEQEKNRPYSLFTVEGGEPTQERVLIEKAKKDKPEDWTAHELRQFGWAVGMDAEQMKGFLDILKRRAGTG